MYLVLDLETTGLDPDKDQILEVAFIRVDEKTLNPIGGLGEEYPIKIDGQWPDMAGPVIEMHTRNHLLEEIANGTAFSLPQIETEIVSLIRRRDEPTYLVGNSIHFDRSFIRRYMPALDRALHYRMIDVSSFNTIMHNTIGAPKPTASSEHRALADCWLSLHALREHVAVMRRGYTTPVV